MNKFIIVLSIFISSAAFAGDCGKNCYQGDINGDKKTDKIEFVIAGHSSLKLKITRTGSQDMIKAHDKYQKPTQSVEEITISNSADIHLDFLMTVLEGQRTVNLQWYEREGHIGLKKFRISPKGKLESLSFDGE